LVDINPSLIVKTCRDLYTSNLGAELHVIKSNSLYKLAAQSLTDYLGFSSALQGNAFKSWTVDEDHPGYLIKIEGNTVVRAPYHIVPSFPDMKTMEGVWEVSRKVKTHHNSVIFLSGSLALLKSSILSSDIDFCEYIITSNADINRALAEKARPNESLLFQRIYFDGSTWDFKSDISSLEPALRQIDPYSESKSFGKIDYIADVRGMRPTDISNVIIFCDPKWESKSFDRTFAAQEVMLDAGLKVPNNMNEPMALGRYVDWLFREMQVHSAKGTFEKALKRALSLSRVCFLPLLTEKISQFISSSKAFLERELAEIENLESRLSISGSDTAALWQSALERSKVNTQRALGDNHKWAVEAPEQFYQSIFRELRAYLLSQKPLSWTGH